MITITHITQSLLILIFIMQTVTAASAQRCIVRLKTPLNHTLTKALAPSDLIDADIALKQANYHIKYQGLEWMRQLHLETGEGFWELMVPNPEAEEEHCAMIPATRIFYSGPGEYQQPHFYRLEKNFILIYGDCHVWLHLKGRPEWDYHYCTHSIDIPANAICCFMAGENGCIMIDDNATAKTVCICCAADEAIFWYTHKNMERQRIPWCELATDDYQVNIDDLIQVTNLARGKIS